MTSPEHRTAPAASWLEVSTENCSVQAALDVVGNKWALLVLRELFNGVRRFDEICVHAGISEAVLARRLKELIAAGVVEARPYREAGQRPRQEYVPTPAGWDLFPVVVGLLQWGDRYRAPSQAGSWRVSHRSCDTPVEVRVVCPEHPLEPIDHHGTRTAPGPSAIIGSL